MFLTDNISIEIEKNPVFRHLEAAPPFQPETRSNRVSTEALVLLHSSSRRESGRFADMHHLRTTFLRLRPLTTRQRAQNLSQPRLLVIEGALRTFQPARHMNASEPFLNGTSSNYLEEMYFAWLDDPKNVHKVLYT